MSVPGVSQSRICETVSRTGVSLAAMSMLPLKSTRSATFTSRVVASKAVIGFGVPLSSTSNSLCVSPVTHWPLCLRTTAETGTIETPPRNVGRAIGS